MRWLCGWDLGQEFDIEFLGMTSAKPCLHSAQKNRKGTLSKHKVQKQTRDSSFLLHRRLKFIDQGDSACSG